MDLGATEWATFRKITLPMIAPGRRRRGAAGRRDLDRRLRDHELQRGPDADVPAVHLRRHPPGRAARGQRAGHRPAGRRAGPDGAQRDAAAPAGRARDAARRRSTSSRRRRSRRPVAEPRPASSSTSAASGTATRRAARRGSQVPPFERPERLAETFRALEGSGVLRKVERLTARSAPRTALELVHDASHVERVLAEPHRRGRARRARRGSGRARAPRRCSRSAGCWRRSAAVVAGELDNAFVLARPPGHHAEAARPMGFCLLNATAVAARWAQLARGARRVAILDWDVHHGNGTEAIFRDDSTVLTISLHQDAPLPATTPATSTRPARRSSTSRCRSAPATPATRSPSSAWSSRRSARSRPTCC